MLSVQYSSAAKQAIRAFFVIALLGLLTGCLGSSNKSRYTMSQDAPPSGYRELSKIPDAVPKVEPRSRGGNKSPYTVLGKTYSVLPTSLGYQATGTASWYGSKFHGHLTSNGEIYNMYAMSAAHKSLPIPTYVRVTNLANDKQVIVRVNDRGPFHGDRLIDLSYAAAAKLGFLSAGTAKVRIEAIDPVAWQRSAGKQVVATTKPVPSTQPSPVGGSQLGPVYIQVAAFAGFASAAELKSRLKGLVEEPVVIYLDAEHQPVLHRVQVGPFINRVEAERVQQLLQQASIQNSIIVSSVRR